LDAATQIEEANAGKEKVGYWGALSDPRYRMATVISVVLAISMQGSGINAINIFSTNIYEQI